MVTRAHLLSFLAVALVLVLTTGSRANGEMKPEFAPGQVWSIKSVPPTTTKIIVGSVEAWNGKIAVHVTLVDVPIPSGLPDAGQLMQIDHAPFEQAALAASVDQLLATGRSPAPNFASAYEEWQSAKGGIFTISVPEAIAVMFQTLTRGHA